MKRLLLSLVAVAALGFAAAPPSLTATIDAVQSGLTSLPADAALENIDGWREALNGSSNPIARDVASDLTMLRAELTQPTIDGDRVGRLLIDMGIKTQRLSIAADASTERDLARLGILLMDAGFRLRNG